MAKKQKFIKQKQYTPEQQRRIEATVPGVTSYKAHYDYERQQRAARKLGGDAGMEFNRSPFEDWQDAREANRHNPANISPDKIPIRKKLAAASRSKSSAQPAEVNTMPVQPKRRRANKVSKLQQVMQKTAPTPSKMTKAPTPPSAQVPQQPGVVAPNSVQQAVMRGPQNNAGSMQTMELRGPQNNVGAIQKATAQHNAASMQPSSGMLPTQLGRTIQRDANGQPYRSAGTIAPGNTLDQPGQIGMDTGQSIQQGQLESHRRLLEEMQAKGVAIPTNQSLIGGADGDAIEQQRIAAGQAQANPVPGFDGGGKPFDQNAQTQQWLHAQLAMQQQAEAQGVDIENLDNGKVGATQVIDGKTYIRQVIEGDGPFAGETTWVPQQGQGQNIDAANQPAGDVGAFRPRQQPAGVGQGEGGGEGGGFGGGGALAEKFAALEAKAKAEGREVHPKVRAAWEQHQQKMSNFEKTMTGIRETRGRMRAGAEQADAEQRQRAYEAELGPAGMAANTLAQERRDNNGQLLPPQPAPNIPLEQQQGITAGLMGQQVEQNGRTYNDPGTMNPGAFSGGGNNVLLAQGDIPRGGSRFVNDERGRGTAAEAQSRLESRLSPDQQAQLEESGGAAYGEDSTMIRRPDGSIALRGNTPQSDDERAALNASVQSRRRARLDDLKQFRADRADRMREPTMQERMEAQNPEIAIARIQADAAGKGVEAQERMHGVGVGAQKEIAKGQQDIQREIGMGNLDVARERLKGEFGLQGRALDLQERRMTEVSKLEKDLAKFRRERAKIEDEFKSRGMDEAAAERKADREEGKLERKFRNKQAKIHNSLTKAREKREDEMHGVQMKGAKQANKDAADRPWQREQAKIRAAAGGTDPAQIDASQEAIRRAEPGNEDTTQRFFSREETEQLAGLNGSARAVRQRAAQDAAAGNPWSEAKLDYAMQKFGTSSAGSPFLPYYSSDYYAGTPSYIGRWMGYSNYRRPGTGAQ